MSTRARLLPLLLVPLIALAVPAGAMTIASSDFEADLDGWFISGDGIASHQTSGGNPGGFLQSFDQTAGSNTDVFAPAKFLGDWSALDGLARISVDFKIVSACCAISEGMEFWISGPGGSASRRLSTASGPFFDWTTYTIDLVESEWNVTRGTWSAMLANIDMLRFDMEHVQGAETTGIDSVLLVMIPEPSTAALVWGGMLGVALRSRRFL